MAQEMAELKRRLVESEKETAAAAKLRRKLEEAERESRAAKSRLEAMEKKLTGRMIDEKENRGTSDDEPQTFEPKMFGPPSDDDDEPNTFEPPGEEEPGLLGSLVNKEADTLDAPRIERPVIRPLMRNKSMIITLKVPRREDESGHGGLETRLEANLVQAL
ncbi:hypothetical protein G7Y89_g14212 [Cudoniella acicularis]|uniref:Uncharacterized protein n=1 Tax=Cudoniella acicularis TaxID=354080 RepID=A0A8H4VUA0_9HELO|nr:hypothetical protein G7Y89_g14212 [Cudoniella acicularis]